MSRANVLKKEKENMFELTNIDTKFGNLTYLFGNLTNIDTVCLKYTKKCTCNLTDPYSYSLKLPYFQT